MTRTLATEVTTKTARLNLEQIDLSKMIKKNDPDWLKVRMRKDRKISDRNLEKIRPTKQRVEERERYFWYFGVSFSLINFLIIHFFKFLLVYVCVYIFARITFKILGQGTFTLIQCLLLYLEVLLSITTFIRKH